ncbi:MAG TPA: tRNA pseudouridine(55) synthase TruB, partial [Fibrobacteria bacterium]|nr:tRNA pseudouridine(55) synthase TruB [Fibrobacteria bacterium]
MTEPGAVGGFLLLDKPPGISSFQALYPVKKLFRGLKVGHAGTLDPAASGLLLVGVGSGTRLLEYLEGMPKTYAFLARFGLVSDTYDMEGTVSGAPDLALDRARVEAALAPFRGCIRQAPPAYSAVKVDGARA